MCFYDDPRFYDIDCYSKIANNTLDCTRTCPENAIGQNAILQEGGSYMLEPDSRCMYIVDWWNKVGTGTEQILIDEAYLENFSSDVEEALGGIRRLQDDFDFQYDDESATQPGVDIYTSVTDFLQMSQDAELKRQSMKDDLYSMRVKIRNNRGKLKEIKLRDEIYVMIINKWPYPIEFSVSGAPNPNVPPPPVVVDQPEVADRDDNYDHGAFLEEIHAEITGQERPD